MNDHAPVVRLVFLGADDDGAVSWGRVRRATMRPGDNIARLSVSDVDEGDSVSVQLRQRSATVRQYLTELMI